MCNDAVFYVDYELKDINYSVGDEKDKIIPMVRVFHSYNGYIRFHVEFGYKRLICSNGLYGYEFSDKFIMKHSHGNINAIINSCNVSVKRFVEQAEQFKSRYDILSQKEVTSPLERIEMVALSTNFPQKQVESVISKYEEEIDEDTTTEAEEDKEDDEEEIDLFDNMNRLELKRYIKQNELDVVVKNSMSDDEIRNTIREYLNDDKSIEKSKQKS